MPTDVYARKVVATVLRRSPTWYWLGNFAWTIWFVSTFLPRTAFVSRVPGRYVDLVSRCPLQDFLVTRTVGLNELTKILRQRRKSQ